MSESVALDPYLILGVESNAPLDLIKESYHKNILEWHPDKNRKVSAAAKFHEIKEAWTILSDPKSRADYDTMKSYKMLSNLVDEISLMDFDFDEGAKIYRKNCRCGSIFEVCIYDRFTYCLLILYVALSPPTPKR